MDTMRTMMIFAQLPKDSFGSYSKFDDCHIGVNLQAMLNILSCAEKKPTFVMKKQGDSLSFKFGGGNESFAFCLNLNEADVNRIAPPERDEDCVVKMDQALQHKVASMLKLKASTVKIKATCPYFTMRTDTEQGNASFEGYATYIESTNEVNQSFSLAKLSHVLEPLKFCDTVEISLKNGDPLIAAYELHNNGGKLVYFLAPKVD